MIHLLMLDAVTAVDLLMDIFSCFISAETLSMWRSFPLWLNYLWFQERLRPLLNNGLSAVRTQHPARISLFLRKKNPHINPRFMTQGFARINWTPLKPTFLLPFWKTETHMLFPSRLSWIAVLRKNSPIKFYYHYLFCRCPCWTPYLVSMCQSKPVLLGGQSGELKQLSVSCNAPHKAVGVCGVYDSECV